MKKAMLILLITLGLTLVGCQDNTNNDETSCDDSQKYINGECISIEDTDEPQDQPDESDDVTVSAGTFGYQTFMHDGLNREYILYLPDNLPDDSPLVFVLHGFGGSAEGIQTYSKMNELADLYQFAVVYPQGTIADFTTHWNAQLDLSEVDDVGFLVDLASHLQTTYNLSPENTFISGHSNGGFMSYTVACQAPDAFGGMASYAGIMSGETWNTCDTTTPFNVLHIHGTSDFVVPDDGSMITWQGWGGAPPVLEMLDYWVNRNALEITTETDLSEQVHQYIYTSDLSPYTVMYYKLIGTGHSWPEDDEILADDDTLNDTSQLIWSFFESLIDNQ